MRTTELVIRLKPNLGWIVYIYRNDRCDGPTHSGYLASKTEAIGEAKRAAARMAKRGCEATISMGSDIPSYR